MRKIPKTLSVIFLFSFLVFIACGETRKGNDNNSSQITDQSEIPYEIITDSSGKEFVVDEQGNKIPMNEDASVEVLFELAAPVDEETLVGGDSLDLDSQGQAMSSGGQHFDCKKHGMSFDGGHHPDCDDHDMSAHPQGGQHGHHNQGRHGHHQIKGQQNGIDFNVNSAFLSVEWLDFGAFKTLACHNPKVQKHHPVQCQKNSARVDGPMIVDLLAGTSTPSFTSLNLPSGAYRSIGVKVEPADAADGIVTSTDTMSGLSLWVSGNFDYNTQPVTFELQLAFDRYMVLAREHGMIVSPLEPNQIVIGFNVEKWFENIPVKKCLDKGELTITNNTLIIDNTSGGNLCKNMLHRIKQNIHKYSHVRHVMKHVH